MITGWYCIGDETLYEIKYYAKRRHGDFAWMLSPSDSVYCVFDPDCRYFEVEPCAY